MIILTEQQIHSILVKNIFDNAVSSIGEILEVTRCKVDLNRKYLRGSTLLHDAIAVKNLDIIKLSIKYGADTKVKDQDGETPLNMARKLNFGISHKNIIAYLERYERSEI